MKKRLLLFSLLCCICSIFTFGQNITIKRITPSVSAPGSRIKVTLKVPANYQFSNSASITLNFLNKSNSSSFSNRFTGESYSGYWTKISLADTLAFGFITVPISAATGNYDVAMVLATAT